MSTGPSIARQTVEENQLRRLVQRISVADKRRRLVNRLLKSIRNTYVITEQLKELDQS